MLGTGLFDSFQKPDRIGQLQHLMNMNLKVSIKLLTKKTGCKAIVNKIIGKIDYIE